MMAWLLRIIIIVGFWLCFYYNVMAKEVIYIVTRGELTP